METNDDFQFKPLSKGLGFHPRKKEPQGLKGLDFTESFSEGPSTSSLAKSDEKPLLSEKMKESPKSSSSAKSIMGKKSDSDPSSIYTIDDGLSLDEMPQYKVPLNREKQTTVNETRSQMELQAKSTSNQTFNSKEIANAKKASLPEKKSEVLKINPAISPSAQTAKQAVDDILKTLKDKRSAGIETPAAPAAKGISSAPTAPNLGSPSKNQIKPHANTIFPQQKLQITYQQATMSWGAAFLDGLLVFAATLLCMIILLTVTRVDLLKALSQSSDREIYFALFGLFALVNFTYMTVHRVILGQTPGEWAFDQRLGQIHEQFELSYIFKAAARTIIIIATGVITLPLISKLMGQDFVADVTGLHLYEKKM